MPLVDPSPAFCFNVLFIPDTGSLVTDLIGTAVSAASSLVYGSFSEVSGLNGGMETEEYREGGLNTGPHKFVKWGKFPNVVFKRGVTPNTDIWDWYYSTVFGSANPIRKNAVVTLNDRVGAPIAVWYVSRGLPETLQGPSLNGKSNEIAIEALEIAHEGLWRVGPATLPGVGDALTSVGV